MLAWQVRASDCEQETKKPRKGLFHWLLAGQNMLHHKPPKFLMGKQIKHLVSSSSF
jgi:hypothetical protein